jgi:Tfp pilus assembly protein PilX
MTESEEERMNNCCSRCGKALLTGDMNGVCSDCTVNTNSKLTIYVSDKLWKRLKTPTKPVYCGGIKSLWCPTCGWMVYYFPTDKECPPICLHCSQALDWEEDK